MKKRILLLIPVFIIAAMAMVPYFVGVYSESIYNFDLDTLNKQYAGRIKVIGNFTRSYLKSTAKTDIVDNDGKLIISLVSTIQHGPIIFSDGKSPRAYKLAAAKTTVDSPFIRTLRGYYGKDDFYEFTADFSYGGDGTVHVKIDPLTVALSDGDLKWSGLDLNGQHLYGAFNLTADLTISELDYKDHLTERSKQLSLVMLKSNLNLNLLNFSFSEATTIGSLKLNIGTDEVVNMLNTNIALKSENEPILSNYEIGLNFDKLKFEQQDMGPFSLFLRLSRFNRNTTQQLFLKPISDSNATIIDDIPFNITQDKLIQFLAVRPAVDGKLTFNTSKGLFNLTTSILVGGDSLTKLDQQSILDTASIKAGLQIDKGVAYPLLTQYVEDEIHAKQKEFFEKNADAIKNPYSFSDADLQTVVEKWLAALLNNLRTNNYVVESPGQFGVSFDFDKQVITINGKVVAKEDLQKTAALLDFKVSDANAAVIPATTPAVPAPATTTAVPVVPSVSAPAATVVPPAPAATTTTVPTAPVVPPAPVVPAAPDSTPKK